MAGYVDAAAAHVLANNEILMSAPSNGKLSAFYPSPAESTNTIAQAVCNSGQLFIRANAKGFGSASDFQISSANILDAPILTMEIEIPALAHAEAPNLYVGSWSAGWGYDLIDSVEVSYSNSNISNLTVTGQALRDWSLMQCKNADERLQLLKIAGKRQVASRAAAQNFRATVPISFLNWAGAGGVDGGFPIDCRTLNGSIQIQFRFRPLFAAIGPLSSNYTRTSVPGDPGTKGKSYGPGTDATFPGEFKNLELTMRSYQLMDSAFSVAHALQANPGMVYSMPSKWINSYRYIIDLTNEGVGEIQLNSAPAGMIQALLLSIRPVAANGQDETQLSYDPLKLLARDTFIYRPARYYSLPLSALRLQYSGQSIYDAHTKEQIEAFNRYCFGDDLKTDIPSFTGNLNLQEWDTTPVAAVKNFPDHAGVNYVAPLHVIPLMHDGDSVFRHRHFENLPHYSGSTLSLSFKVDTPLVRADPYQSIQDVTGTATSLNIINNLTNETSLGTNFISVGGAAKTDAAVQSAALTINRVELVVTYVVAALLQSTNGVVELQL